MENTNLKILSTPNNLFEDNYIKAREKEKRVYTEQEITNLPFISKSDIHYKEWNMRVKSYQRFKKYIEKKNNNLSVLEIGCGNGWFSARLADIPNTKVAGLDVNLTELKQASSIFKKNNLTFFYGNIFEEIFPSNSFDIIVLNAAVQYFPNLTTLINQLNKILKENGEIHFIDSPFYKIQEIINAKQRTLDYYTQLGYPEMSTHYYHHDFNELKNNTIRILYNPSTFSKKIKSILFGKDSPFLWIKIKK